MADPEERSPSDRGGQEGVAPSGQRSPSHTPEAYAETQAGVGGPAAGDGSSGPSAGSGNDEEAPDPLLGKVLGGLYKVEDRIGEGGMGTVYVAVHIHLNKRFAVKVLSPRVAEDGQAMERLRQEAVAASSIDHDNIVDVVSFDSSDDGDVFIVMELLRGASLADLLGGEPMPLARALPIVHQIADALGAAHERGIVHRDLKPENVFVASKGGHEVAKVLDFGISKVKSAEAEQVRMTQTGQLVGTPLYMSPEQARGESDVDRRADIYALGVILYEMLTGTPPFEGNNYFQLLWKHGNEPPPPPRERSEDVPAAIEKVILKALAKSPDERYETMEELKAALMEAAPEVAVPQRFLSAPPRSTPMSAPPSLPARKRWPWLALGAAIAVLAIITAVGAFGPSDAEPARPEEAQVAAAAAAEGRDPADDGDEAPRPPREAGGEAAGGESAEQELPEGAAPPARVEMKFLSRPSGATVHVGDRAIGETPVTADVESSDEEVQVRFSRRGYRSKVVSVVPREDEQVTARLRPRAGGSTPAESPIKTGF